MARKKDSVQKWVASMAGMLVIMLAVCAPAWAAGADNVYLGPVNPSSSDIVMSDWSPVQTTPYTYWATQNWNQGAEGGGYAGFQQDSSGSWAPRRAHFALWDPINSTLPITARYHLAEEGARVSTFGGEGTGLKVMTPLNWQMNQYYRMVVRTWGEGCTGTCFGQWVKDVSANEWKLIAILEHPVAGLNLHGGLGLFQEDWMGTSQNVREARVKNGYNRTTDGLWNSWAAQKISSNNNLGNWDGGATSDYFWFRAGGTSTPSIASGSIKTISQPSTPVLDNIDFAEQQASYKDGKLTINWKLQPSSSPQFSYDVALYNNAALNGAALAHTSAVRPEASSVTLTVPLEAGITYFAKLTITDLFGQSSYINIPVTAESEGENSWNPNVWYRLINKKSGKAVDVPYSSTSNGVQLIQYLNTSNPNQQWSIMDTGSGSYKLTNRFSGKAMDVKGSSSNDGAAVIQYDYLGGSNQKWRLEAVAPGYYVLLNVSSGKALDVEGTSTADSALLVQNTYTGADSQQWKIEEVN